MRFPMRWLPLLISIPLATAFPEGAIGYNDLFGRAAVQCNGGQLCGYYSTLCCASNACYTDANNQAQCKTYFTPQATAAGGYMTVATTTYTTNGPYTITSTYSTYIAGATQTAQVAVCDASLNQQSCGNICCGSNQYCSTVLAGTGSCAAYTAGSTGYVTSYMSTMYATDSAGVPLRPTASTLIVVTVSTSVASTTTNTPATTEPFTTPIATGANVTVTNQGSSNGGGGLSGGAIAGIVIGVLAALFILGLICFYCCLKGILDGCLALFGLGRRRKEVDIYERRTHHSSGGAAAGRTWYGAPRPARDNNRRRNSEGMTLLGLGAGLAALWAILGLKRKSERRKAEEKQSEYSYYSSDYYTSESSASSDDRRRDDRRSSRPSRR